MRIKRAVNAVKKRRKILKLAKQDGHTLRLFNLQPKIKKLFLICSLDSIMEIA